MANPREFQSVRHHLQASRVTRLDWDEFRANCPKDPDWVNYDTDIYGIASEWLDPWLEAHMDLLALRLSLSWIQRDLFDSDEAPEQIQTDENSIEFFRKFFDQLEGVLRGESYLLPLPDDSDLQIVQSGAYIGSDVPALSRPWTEWLARGTLILFHDILTELRLHIGYGYPLPEDIPEQEVVSCAMNAWYAATSDGRNIGNIVRDRAVFLTRWKQLVACSFAIAGRRRISVDIDRDAIAQEFKLQMAIQEGLRALRDDAVGLYRHYRDEGRSPDIAWDLVLEQTIRRLSHWWDLDPESKEALEVELSDYLMGVERPLW